MDESESPPGAFSYKYQQRCKRRLDKRRNGTATRAVMLEVEKYMEVITAILPKNKTLIDIGAGTGNLVQDLRDLGYSIKGIDGTIHIEELTCGLVRWVDLTADCDEWYGAAQWGICLEVGEHIPPEFESNFLDQICRIPTEALLISWALPEPETDSFHGHVNCREKEYVMARLAERGWTPDKFRFEYESGKLPVEQKLRNMLLFRKEK